MSLSPNVIKPNVHYCHLLSSCVTHNIIVTMVGGWSDEKRRRNIVKAGSTVIVGQHHENVLNIFI